MADYHANILYVGYDDIYNELYEMHEDDPSVAIRYRDFFTRLFNKLRNTQGLSFGESVFEHNHAKLQIPFYDGTYSGSEKIYLDFYNGSISVDNLMFSGGSDVVYLVSIIKESETEYTYDDRKSLFVYRNNGRITYIGENELYINNSSDFKLMLIQESPSYLNGYRFAFGTNYGKTSTDFLDAWGSYYVVKAIDYITGNETTALVRTWTSPYTMIVADSSSEDDFVIDPMYLYQNSTGMPDNEIYLSRVFNRGYYAEDMFLNGNVTNTTSSSKGSGGNKILHQYLYSKRSNEYIGLIKDGILIDGDEYYGLIEYGNYDFGLPSTRRILFKK